ncbi:hypothetical protein LCM02_09335 [Lutimonas saemankumensis]|uniref:MATE family efflux transporter n=1 Tax=Lutimonas saemankumensis TaxID=483016 RepID=UPI001CD7269C|nr:MATE family efflux transporter [Lutimonas saemankumensis]MCA0932653.1 hypothetical protein [Lutimonas saemankumensis]
MKARRVAKNTGFLYARMGITVFISLYVTRLVLAALGTEDFGIYNVVAGMIAMLVFLNSAMTSASLRFMSFAHGEENEEKQKKVFNVSVILHLIIGFIIVVFIELIGFFLFRNILQIPDSREYAAKMIFHFMVVSTFFSIISVPYDAVINARENMLFVAILGVFESILKLGIAFYITYTVHDKLIIYGMLMATLSLLFLAVKRVYSHRRYREVTINFQLYFDKPLFREMTSFAGWSFLGVSTSMVANYGQGIVLNSFFGPVVNASQGIANQISGQLGVFSTTMLKALKPVIAKSEGSGNRSLMLNASLMGSKVSYFLLLFVYVPVFLEMPFLFDLWLESVPVYAIVFCRLLLIRNLIEQLFIPLYSSIEAVGKIRKFHISSSILNTLPLVIAVVLFSLNLPPPTIYLVFIGYSILYAIIILYYAKVNCSLSISLFFKQVVLRCFIVTIGVYSIGIIPSVLMNNELIRVVFTLLFSFMAFLVLVWWLGLTKEENTVIKSLVRK